MSKVKGAGSGGAATAAGIKHQEDVACYFSTLILAESFADPPAELPQSVDPVAIVAESGQPIDDLLIETSVEGVLYIQAKTSLSLSKALEPSQALSKVNHVKAYTGLNGVTNQSHSSITNDSIAPDLSGEITSSVA